MFSNHFASLTLDTPPVYSQPRKIRWCLLLLLIYWYLKLNIISIKVKFNIFLELHHVVKVGLNVTFLPSKALDRISKCTTICMCVKVKKLSLMWAVWKGSCETSDNLQKIVSLSLISDLWPCNGKWWKRESWSWFYRAIMVTSWGKTWEESYICVFLNTFDYAICHILQPKWEVVKSVQMVYKVTHPERTVFLRTFHHLILYFSNSML